MRAVQESVWDMLAAIADDPAAAFIPAKRDDRAAVRAAVAKAAREHKGLVHISYVRPLLPTDIAPHVIGAVMSGLHTSGHLIVSNRPPLPNGGPSGNASKLARVSRLVKEIL